MWRHVKDVLLLKPAVTSRNLVTVLLVALMFGVYIASGGKVTTVPQVRPGSGFGTVDDERVERVKKREAAPVEEVAVEAEPAPQKKVETQEDIRKRFAENLKNDPRKLSGETPGLTRDSARASRASGIPEVTEPGSAPDVSGGDDDFSALEKRLKKGRR